ncbi:DUF6816 family protein [Cyanobium sp. LEGE 06113]|uniref:DUF6816 family protein n=1 Tax=Cyanobium sp. LEGE 06113 TaxID=1297573 RepID=UPI001880EF00|nr:POLO box duplicated region [Cyanobium sp. LEGE 06113]MBE9154577.1 POLO box duplicated region [Cyanobium sp. LEGE 06113]
MGNTLMAAILALWFAVWPAAGSPGPSPLEARIAQWPAWSLPAPLTRPGRRDLAYPAWFEGAWLASDDDGSQYQVRFLRDGKGAVVGDRAFNAGAIGNALLGDALLGVENDPADPNRQIARLRGPEGTPFQLESSVIGRRSDQPATGAFLADELALQVLHGPGQPRLSRVETLSRFQLRSDGSIEARQWQATYPSPTAGLAAQASSSRGISLKLVPLRPDPAGPGSHRAS